MKMLPLQIRSFLKIKHPKLLTGVVLGVVAAGLVAYQLTLPKPSHYVAPSINGHTPTPAPGEAGNPGDVSKEEQGKASTTPTPTSAGVGAGTLGVTDFNVTPQPDGTVRVQNDQISGATSGTCTITLTSPSKNVQTMDGQIASAGTYYFCSFGTITGVTEKGRWNASLSVKSVTGATGKANDTTFEVN